MLICQLYPLWLGCTWPLRIISFASGQIVAEGTPEEVAQVQESHTGRFLEPRLSKHSHASVPADQEKALKDSSQDITDLKVISI